MNIKFGMDNFYVRYLKRFLNHELEQSNNILSKFNKLDLLDLVKYLNLPNVKNMAEVSREIVVKFPELLNEFNMNLQNDTIIFTSKVISQDSSEFLMSEIDEIKKYCISVGWLVSNIAEWVDISKDINDDGIVDYKDRNIIRDIVNGSNIYSEEIIKKADVNLDGIVNEEDISAIDEYINNGRVYIEISKSNRSNYFPNKDMLVFINQFDGTFLYNYAIRDGGVGADDSCHPNPSGLYKIALYKCTPGQKVTIAHNSNQDTDLVIGCASVKLKQDLKDNPLHNIKTVRLKPGEGYQYTCSSEANQTGYDAQWLCIQCPSDYGDIGGNTKSVLLEVGDVNFDGQINMQDYQLISSYTAKGPGAEKLNWKATPKQKAVMDINGDSKINNEDATMIYNFIQGKDLGVIDLGLTVFTYNAPGDPYDGNNVDNFLIIDGHYDDDVNIPFIDFVTNDWVIHEKFFNYLFGIAIHNYSDSENISYLQSFLKEYYPDHYYDRDYFYPGVYSDNMKNLVKSFQKEHIHYTLGDLNRDNRLDSIDLQILRNYLDKLNEEEIETQSLIRAEEEEEDTGPNQLQLLRMDVNQDNVIDEQDYNLLKDQIEGKTEELNNYDVSFMLGWCDVQTEMLMETEINLAENISEVSK